MMATAELHLFVLWEKSRRAEKRILDDLAERLEIVCTRELQFPEDAELCYRRFYGPALPDSSRKLKTCGAGPFLLVVVRDPKPVYVEESILGSVKPRDAVMVELKDKYRAWTGSGHRVHGTVDAVEFDRDILMLTGHTGDEWRLGVPDGPWSFRFPDGWGAVMPDDATMRIEAQPLYLKSAGVSPRGNSWEEFLSDYGESFGLSDLTLFLENKYINDCFYRGRFRGRACVVKCCSKAIRSIRNEFQRARQVYAHAPGVVSEPLAFFVAADGRRAFSVMARVEGPSLTEILEDGISDSQADSFSGDILDLAQGLKASGVLHRDLFTDNLLLGADGHLKAIDWQLAIVRRTYSEDPWVKRNWKFRYVVFGVNRELGLGVWNDFHALGKILAQFPQTEKVKAVAAELSSAAPEMSFASPPRGLDRLRLWLYGCSLRLQMLIRGRKHRKYAQLERRWRTVRCKWE